MRDYKRYHTIDYPGLLSSFIASWILHCILFAIASTTTVFYPPTADREIISVDLIFASPVSGPVGVTMQKLTQSSPSPTEDRKTAEDNEPVPDEPVNLPMPDVRSDSQTLDLMTMIAPKPEEKKVPPAKSPPLHVPPPKIKKVSKVPPAPQTTLPESGKIPEVEHKREEVVKKVVSEAAPPPVLTQTKTLEQSDHRKMAVENEKLPGLQEAEQRAANERAHKEAREAKNAREAELEKQEAEKSAKMRLATEYAKIEREEAEKKRSEQVARLRKEEEKIAKEKQARERAAQEKISQARLIANSKKNENALPVKPSKGANAVVSIKTEGTAIAAAVPPLKPLIAGTTTNTMNNQPKNEQKGLALPPVTGDIKLIITSEDDLIVKVLFISHPKARHDKPLSKKEARELQKLTPIVVRSEKNTLEAVIERSREGIYIFQLEQKGSKPANGKYSLKLYDSKSRSITSREISGLTEIARLLMPEGILWEDDSAFSGNIEDSESVTKFNSDTGLMWKEYRK